MRNMKIPKNIFPRPPLYSKIKMVEIIRHLTKGKPVTKYTAHCTLILYCIYSWSFRKQPPREFKKMVETRAGCLREWALENDCKVKQSRVVAYESFRNSSLINNSLKKEQNKLMFNECLYVWYRQGWTLCPIF